jgi:hypothetical protein
MSPAVMVRLVEQRDAAALNPLSLLTQAASVVYIQIEIQRGGQISVGHHLRACSRAKGCAVVPSVPTCTHAHQQHGRRAGYVQGTRILLSQGVDGGTGGGGVPRMMSGRGSHLEGPQNTWIVEGVLLSIAQRQLFDGE